MKWFLLPALLLTALHLGAQVTTNKLPKLGYDNSGFAEGWHIGDNAVKKRDVQAHLFKNENSTGQAYPLFLKGNSNNTAAWLYLGVAAIGAGLALFGIVAADGSPTSGTAFTGYGIFAGGTTAALISSTQSGKNYKLAIKEYNHFAGY